MTKLRNRDIVLRHLRTLGHITPAEAILVHRIVRLAPRILELRKDGARIKTRSKVDGAGTNYTTYVYSGQGLAGTGVRWWQGEKVERSH